MTVIVQLRGGLGNQLFQYASGYALSARHGTELVLDTALLPPSTVDRGGVRRWPEQISSFAHAGRFIDSAGTSSARKRVAQSWAGRERALGDSRFRSLLGQGVYARETREDVAAFDRLPAAARINSYCNSWRYFSDVSAEISRQVSDVAQPSEWFLQTAAEMREARPIALHVRWGDYLNLAKVYGTIGVDYYRRAVDRIAQSIGERPLWLFSDDPAGATSMLQGLTLHRVIDPPASSSSLENLVLLGGGAGIACANSSFSWWAAFLASPPAGAVVFPRPLFAVGGPEEPKEWLRPDWMQLGRD